MSKLRESRLRRHRRVRKKVSGTPQRPRLAVFRSNRHLYAQLIDDDGGHTIAYASTLDPSLAAQKGKTSEAAQSVGKLVAERAIEKGITTAVFDRGGFRFHGRIKALADSAREQGLKF